MTQKQLKRRQQLQALNPTMTLPVDFGVFAKHVANINAKMGEMFTKQSQRVSVSAYSDL